MSIQSEIDRINTAKADIASALADRGVDASGHSLSAFADDVRAISVVQDVQVGGSSVVEDGIAQLPESLPLVLTYGVHYFDTEADLPAPEAGRLVFVKRA